MSKYTYIVRQFNGAPVRTFASLAAARTWARAHSVLAAAHTVVDGCLVWTGYMSRAERVRAITSPEAARKRLQIERHGVLTIRRRGLVRTPGDDPGTVFGPRLHGSSIIGSSPKILSAAQHSSACLPRWLAGSFRG